MKTKEKLARELQIAKAPGWMVANAIEGHYDDFESDIDTPIKQLVDDLNSLGMYDFSKRAMEGEFDSTKEESEAWFQKEGKNFLKDLG